MKVIRKALLLLLVLATVLSFAACGETPSDPDDTSDTSASETTTATESETVTTEQPPQGNKLSIAVDGRSEFRIIYSDEAGSKVINAAKNLRTKIKDCTGVTLAVTQDTLLFGEKPDPNACEILIGNTNREESAAVLENAEGINDYVVWMSGNKLVLNGKHDDAIVNAVYYFINQIVAPSLNTKTLAFSESQNYLYKAIYTVKDFTVLGNPAKPYKMVLSENAAYSEYRFALRLQYLLASRTGYQPEIVYDNAPASDYEILIGKTARTTSTVGDFEYAIAAKGNRVEILADSAYGYEFLYEYCNTQFCTLMKNSKPNGGDLCRTSTREKITKEGIPSLLGKTGDLRLMQFNILGIGAVPVAGAKARNLMVAEIVESFLPDVFCVQEYTEPMRRSENSPLSETITKLGYAETTANTVDSHRQQTVLFYRTDVLEVVDCGTLFFNVNSQDPENGTTWAVFKDKKSGNKFAAFSTHLYYLNSVGGDPAASEAGDALRMQEAPILVNKIKEVVGLYDCPVFISGDMNCQIGSPAMNYLEQNGCIDVFKFAEVADDFGTYLGNDPAPSSATGIFESAHRTGKPYMQYTVDHTILGGDGIRVDLHDVLNDCFSTAISDHAATVVDFSFDASAVTPAEHPLEPAEPPAPPIEFPVIPEDDDVLNDPFEPKA